MEASYYKRQQARLRWYVAEDLQLRETSSCGLQCPQVKRPNKSKQPTTGGYVWVYSELGHGSVFKVYLPRVDQPVPHAPASDLAPTALSGSETILVVEDEESVRILICSILEQNGYTVLAANSPAQALEITQQHQTIHLLLTDVVLPEMKGPALAKKIEEMRPGLKVLFMSGYSSGFGVSSGLLADGMLLLQKPFSKTALLQRLRGALEPQTEIKLA